MTADISLRLYELTVEFIHDKTKAKEFVSKIEATIEQKIEEKEKGLSSKEDIKNLEIRILEKLNDNFKWIVGLFIPLYLSIVGLVITLLLKH